MRACLFVERRVFNLLRVSFLCVWITLTYARRCTHARRCTLHASPNTDGWLAQNELSCRSRSRNACWYLRDACSRSSVAFDLSVGCVASRPSIQLNALRDERVLFVDFNRKMKNFMFVCSLSCLIFRFRRILQSPGTHKWIDHHDSLGAVESWIQMRRGTKYHRSCWQSNYICFVRLEFLKKYIIFIHFSYKKIK